VVARPIFAAHTVLRAKQSDEPDPRGLSEDIHCGKESGINSRRVCDQTHPLPLQDVEFPVTQNFYAGPYDRVGAENRRRREYQDEKEKKRTHWSSLRCEGWIKLRTVS
jgi:hypothetical protein